MPNDLTKAEFKLLQGSFYIVVLLFSCKKGELSCYMSYFIYDTI